MANNTLKAMAGLKYGQTLNETAAAAVAAEWQKALKKAGAAMRAARLGALMEERAQSAAELAQLEDVRVTFADSIAGGNCQPGTRSFVGKASEVLGYEPESLSGADVIKFGRRFGLELYARRAVKAAERREAGK